jgi:hypothetical protein
LGANSALSFTVAKLDAILGIVIPHFSVYPLVRHKLPHFLIWKEGVELMKSKAHLTPEDLARTKEHELLLNKKTPQGPKRGRLPIKTRTSEFLEYFVGLVDGDGCFSVCKCGNFYKLQFSISQPLYNIRILYYIKSKLGYGGVTKNKNKGEADCRITDRKVLAKRIFPIFDTLLLRTSKYFHCYYLNKAYVILEDLQLTTEDKVKLLESLLQEPLPVDNCSQSLNGFDPLLSSYEEISLVITDNWLSGFVDAESCFGISRDGECFNVEFFLVPLAHEPRTRQVSRPGENLDRNLLELIRRI